MDIKEIMKTKSGVPTLDLMLIFPCTPLLSSRYRLSTVKYSTGADGQMCTNQICYTPVSLCYCRTALYGTVLPCTSLHGMALYLTAWHLPMLHCMAWHCYVLHETEPPCLALHCIALCGMPLICPTRYYPHCATLRYTAFMHYTELLCTV